MTMNWVKQKYDLVILAVATLLLVSNAAWIGMSRLEPEDIQAGPSAPKDNAIPPVNLDVIRQAEVLAAAPAKWKSPTDFPTGSPERGLLLVSRRYLLKDSKLIDPLAEGSEQLHPPITNEWLLVHELDYTDMNIRSKDSDGDGFSNLEEFQSQTNPTDFNKAPPSLNKLKLVSFKQVPFLLKFNSLSKEEITLKRENDKYSSAKAIINFSPEDWNIDNQKLANYFKQTIKGTKNEYKNKISKNELDITLLQKKAEILEKKLKEQRNDERKIKPKTEKAKKNASLIDETLKNLKKTSDDLIQATNLLETNKESLNLLNEVFPEETEGNISTNISITKILPSPKNPDFIQFENDGTQAALEIDREFQINFNSSGKTVFSQYLKLGNQIEGAPYKIVKYEPKPGPNGVNSSGDLSELIIQNIETGDSIILVYNKEANDPTSFGTFRSLLAGGDQDFTLKKGEEFTLKPDNRRLKLVDISATKADIRDVTTGDLFPVFPINSSSP